MAAGKSFLDPLSHTDFRNLWLASIASNLGALIQGVGAAWLMTSITSSAHMVALVQASTSLPIMLFSILAGAIADNFDRRKVMLIAQSFMLAASVLLSLSAWLFNLTPWVLLMFTFLIGTGNALNYPSWQASIGDLVPRKDVPDAVSLTSMSVNTTRSVGPAIGGFLVALGGAALAFAANALSYLALIIALIRWHPDPKANGLPREFMGQAVKAGFDYVSMSPNLLRVYARSFVFGTAAIAMLALLPVLTHQVLQAGPMTYGLMLGTFGFGAVCAALMNPRLRTQFSSETIIKLSFGGFVLSEFAIVAWPNYVSCAVSLMIAGASWVIALSLFNTIVQLSAPRWVVGRAMSIYQTASFAGMTGGSWLWGSLADSHNVMFSLAVAGAVALFGLVSGHFISMPAFEAHDLDPMQHFKEPALKLDILPRSGPITIQISYEIRNEDLETFLSLMTWRRRVRIRDGAKRWTLMRDLENPNCWMEQYHTPTWADYLRHNNRRTKADAENHSRLLALHQGEKPVFARRLIERQTIPPKDDVFHQ